MISANNSERKYDMVVFGASSFVGRFLCEHLIDYCGVNGSGGSGSDKEVQWAIAGRSEQKLGELIDTLGKNARQLPVIVAEASSEQDMRRMCGQTKVVISTVGPYEFYGSVLVKVCAETGTDYCDLTGEPQWIHTMINQYEDIAMKSGARIVHSCGFDSVPSDMGTWYLQKQSKQRLGECCSDVAMRVHDSSGGASGGTIASMINLWKAEENDPELRRLMADRYSNCPVGTTRSLRQKSLDHAVKDPYSAGWVAPFFMATVNERAVMRSNALNRYHEDFTYHEGIATGPGIKGAMGAKMLSAAGRVGRWVLRMPTLLGFFEKYVLPKAGEGPSEKVRLNGFFDMRFYGKTSRGQSITVKVAGKGDPGYEATLKMIAQAALSLARDISKEEKPGGFWPPAVVFDERYIQRLEAHGEMTFEVL